MNPACPDDLAVLRNRLINEALLGLTIISVPAVAFSLWRTVLIGWKPVFALYLVLPACVCFLWLRREHISYSLRVAALLVMFWLVAVAGLAQFGLVAGGREFAVLFALTSILFIGGRAGWWLVVGNVLCMALVGLASVNHWLSFDLDYQSYTHHPVTWITTIWNSAGYSAFVAYIAWRLINGLHERETVSRQLFERQQKIAANVPGVIYQSLLRRDGTACFPYASEGILRLIGVSPQALEESADVAFGMVHPDDIAGVRLNMLASARDLTRLHETIRVIHPETGIVWVERYSTPERLPNGDTLWHGFMIDVSDRVATEEALRTSESLFRSLLEASPLSIAVVEGPEQKLIVLNHCAIETFGYTHEDLPDVAHWWRRAYPNADYRDGVKSEWYRRLSVARETGTIMIIESVVTCKDGTRKPTEIHASFTGEFGIMVLNDLTQKKLIEAELVREKQSAEEANLAKSTFLASMSHELRTPLNSIIGFAQMLDMGAVAPLDPSQKEAVGHILGSGRHLLGLINELLDFARIESGQMHLAVTSMALDPVIGEAVALTRPVAQRRQITIRHDCHTTMVVRADVARVRQILLNLLSNAVKYNRENGGVSISCVTEDDLVRIIVTDTGPGIAKEHLARLFQPFQRLGAERTDIEGTGIGLVICKKLAEAMGGGIGFDSEVGVGSRFWVELPVNRSATSELAEPDIAVPEAATEGSPNVRGRVIYVEDNPVNVNVMQHVFRRLPGVELLIADDAENSLIMIQQTRPDLVLMDINLPGMSGLDVLRILKSDPETAAIPVFAVSAAALPRDIQAGLDAGFLAYLTKPFDVAALLSQVEGILRWKND